jgi:beta-galactosidase/beta-glucuronidase
MKHTKSYHEGHPNPQGYRPDFLLLNGKWNFLFDDEDVGLSKKYYENFPKTKLIINVPYAYESPRSGIEDKSEHNVLWYQKSFDYEKKKDVVLLHIEKSDYLTKVWLNGNYVGEHKGGYDAFTFDVSKHLVKGNNSLVIRVYDSKDARQPRGKQTWKATPFECFYHGTSGIYGDIWLEEVDNVYLKRFILTPVAKERKLKVKAMFSDESIGFKFTIKAAFAGEIVAKHEYLIKSNIQEFEMLIPGELKLWSTETPHLYDLELCTGSADKVLSYFGFNDVGIKGKYITLNEKETYLKFVLDQGYFWGGDLTATYEDFMIDINYLKAAGFNGVRKHEKVESKLFFYLADRYGLLNWVEYPSPHLFDNNKAEVLKEQWTNIIKEHMSHPSVMAYVCYNESWGVHQILTDTDQQKFTVDLYHLTKKLDPHRLAISNDGWEHTESDLLTVHNYQETYEELTKTYENMESDLKTKGNTMANETRKAYAEGYKYRGEPILITEFAGIAIDHNTSDGWGYGKAAIGTEGFLAKLEGQLKAIKKFDFFVGYCITQLSDVYQEKNGLLAHDRSIKIDPKELKELISKY